MLPSLRAQQYQTHRQLLARTRARLGEGSHDAIIVPASRLAVNLDHAVTLARALDCWLVVLCEPQCAGRRGQRATRPTKLQSGHRRGYRSRLYPSKA